MPASASSTREQLAPRFRAARACKACHIRRVKCDAVDRGRPCTRCEKYDIAPCILIESKRGKYQRKTASLDRSTAALQDKIQTPAQASSGQRPKTSVASDSSPLEHRPSATTPPSSTLPALCDDIEPSQRINVVTSPKALAVDASTANNEPNAIDTRPESATRPGGTRAADHDQPQQPPQTHASAGSARSDGGIVVDSSTPGSDATCTTTASSYREISWIAMFDHFLDSRRQNQPSAIDKCEITYLGESFPLAMVLDGMRTDGRATVHYPGPRLHGVEADPGSGRSGGFAGDDDGTSSNKSRKPSHMAPEDLAVLEKKGAFSYPQPETLASLQAAFLHRVYPSYPIVNRRDFLLSVEEKTIPWILLHSICFIAATYCPLSVLHQAGFQSRQAARLHYYKLAKALFDAGYENNKVVLLQSVTFLAFFAGGPNDQWNFYSWNSMAVTIAETLGIHRSLEGANMSSQDKSMLRRLWWTLVIRDASCGALFGRPFRINIDACDAEMLSLDDFHHDMDSSDPASEPGRNIFALYQIHMAKLSLVLRHIVGQRFGATSSTANPVELNQMLQAWSVELPPELHWNKGTDRSNPFALCLSILYSHHVILANIGQSATFIGIPNAANTLCNISQSGSDLVSSAAQHIMSLAGLIIRRSMALSMPQEAYPGIFLAQVVFYTQSRSSQPLTAQLGSVALSNCQVIWHTISEAWDSAPWVMRLFDNLLAEEDPGPPNGNPADNPKKATKCNLADNPEISTDCSLSGNPDDAEMTLPTAEMPDFGLFVDTWQRNSMLSSVLDMSLDSVGCYDASNMVEPDMIGLYSCPDMNQYKFP